MGKNQSASNLTNIIKQDASGSIAFMHGNTMLMSVSSSGAIATTGNVAGTASYASNAELLDGLDSTVFTLTSSFAAQTASFTAFTASVNTFTASQLVLNGTYATTGSNTFAGIQTVNSNLIVTGSITAQTLVVQTITSSVDFVTGSTRFGSTGSNTHVFTGSVSVTGSSTFNGALTAGGPLTIQAGTGLTKHYFTAAGSGDALNQLYDNTGTVKVQLYTNGDSYLNGGKVGIGTTTPQAFLHIAGQNGTNTLTLGTSNNYEIFITGSDSANIYHASPNQAIYLNTNGGPLYLGTSAASTLLTVTGSNVGIGTTDPTATLQVRGPNAVGTFFDAQNVGAGGAVFSRINASSTPYNQYVFNNGYVGIGVTSPQSILHISNGEIVFTETGFSTVRLHKISHGHSDGSSSNNFLGFQVSDGSGNTAEKMRINGSGNVGIDRTNPLAKLSVYGGAFQLMGDYANHQTIIKNAGTAGTLNGSLTITVPDMAGAAGSVGYGGYSCEVYVAGYNAMYCHAWFSGYTNNGVTPSETAILRSNGGWSVSQFGNGSQGLTFVIDYPSGLIHPTARIIINKGGHAYENEYPANSITTVWT